MDDDYASTDEDYQYSDQDVEEEDSVGEFYENADDSIQLPSSIAPAAQVCYFNLSIFIQTFFFFVDDLFTCDFMFLWLLFFFNVIVVVCDFFFLYLLMLC